MSQTSAIASINSLLLQLPEPLQVEALHYVEYLNSRRVASLWEIAIKVGKGKLDLGIEFHEGQHPIRFG